MKPRMHLFWLFFLVPLLVHAEIYRWVDKDGNTVYSDRPRQGASKVDLPPITTYKPGAESSPAGSGTAGPNQQQATKYYTSLQILSPAKNQTIRDPGTVDVRLQLSPSLRPGDEILLKLDDAVTRIQSLSYTYNFVDRGTHTLSASVVDSQGNTLLNASPVVFYVHRHSILQKKPKT